MLVGGVNTTQKGHFQALNFQELKLFLKWKLILNQHSALLASKHVINGFIEYMYAYRPFWKLLQLLDS